MSFGTIGNYDAMVALQAAKAAGGTKRPNDASAQMQTAFDMQMRMAQNIFGEGSQRYGEGSSPTSFDTSMINDSVMLEALSTITRLMRSEAGLPQQVAVSRSAAKPSPKAQPSSDISQVVSHTPLAKAPDVGTLSARFESGSGGISTIGYDRVGGTSYGKYQIASRPGTMDRFLNYLDDKAPEYSQRLRDSGPANTGSKQGGMPTAWKAIANEDPARFEKLQHDFIASETYDPARNMILKQTGLDFNNAPPVLREVLWSTSVQHGPTGAARIFGKVIDQFVGGASDGEFNAKLIEGVYNTRKGQFGSSTKRVQDAVVSRLNAEKQIALNMLGEKRINRMV
ncbi:hypothetical protein [Pseudodesulfovibrio sp. zrk46]|uniref:VgrG-related protein n=1 Tax=Pseudodesulfovibrio sp. zrk46 TaxID=2725288 RepID=UPI001449E2C6|nr:hypothetical protein [Pseudodesulfovibrio sp. zrk46]QJB58011.1 hypothetical protein HFN16_17205 [Pseudodesulfovibrio sp. zrk46]